MKPKTMTTSTGISAGIIRTLLSTTTLSCFAFIYVVASFIIGLKQVSSPAGTYCGAIFMLAFMFAASIVRRTTIHDLYFDTCIRRAYIELYADEVINFASVFHAVYMENVIEFDYKKTIKKVFGKQVRLNIMIMLYRLKPPFSHRNATRQLKLFLLGKQL